jgi:TIR domain
MPSKSKRHVQLFVSYSREDEAIVKPVVQLLRVTDSKVFLDVDSIVPGDRWQEELENSLSRADKICVFWCLHSAESEWVEREWRYAHQKNKRIIPLLLDSTPLKPELSEYQYIDFRVVEGYLHPRKDGYYPAREPPEPGYSVEEEYRRLATRIVEDLIPLIEVDSRNTFGE